MRFSQSLSMRALFILALLVIVYFLTPFLGNLLWKMGFVLISRIFLLCFLKIGVSCGLVLGIIFLIGGEGEIPSISHYMTNEDGEPNAGSDRHVSSSRPSIDLNMSPAEQAVKEMNQRVLLEINNQKQVLADLLEPLIQNEAGRSGINRETLPSSRDVVEDLIRRIGSSQARAENQTVGDPIQVGPEPDFKTPLKKWLTRACNNAQDENKGQLPLRSEIRTIIEKYSSNDG